MSYLSPSNPWHAAAVRLVIGLACSLLILAALIDYVTGSHEAAVRPQLVNLLTSTALTGVLCYLVLHLTGIVVRAIRYRLLLRAADPAATPSFSQMLLVTGFRNMVVDMLPSRLGELGYVALLNRAYGVPMGACFSSLAISAVFDFIALALIILVTITLALAAGNFQGWLLGALIMATLVAITGVLTLVRLVPWITARLEAMRGDSLPRRWIGKLADLASAVTSALGSTRDAGVIGKTLLLSLLIRCLKYTSIFLLFLAVAGPSLPALDTLTRSEVLAGIIGAEIGASLPIPTFMSFGSYEAGGTLVFGLLDIDQKAGLLALLATHIWSQVADYSIGAICLLVVLWTTRRRRRDPHTAGDDGPANWKLVVRLLVVGALLVGATLAVALQYRGIKKMGAFSAPPRGESLRTADSPQLTKMAGQLDAIGARGFMVWSSNRSGNHDILRMRLPDGEVTALTDHPHTETYPRLSADGRQLLFMRSQEPWVSQRNTVAWDIMLLDLESGEERLIAHSASYPFWIDPQSIGYLDRGEVVTRHALDTDQRSVLLQPGGDSPVRQGATITSPSYNPSSDTLAFTARQSAIGLDTGFWGTALYRGAAGQQPVTLDGVHEGCELTWAADGRSLYQVGHGGRMETRFYTVDPASLAVTPLLDLPGEFSHEYWPKDDRDGNYLVFGASRGDHEHDTADYEIFLWKIGSPAEQAVRLTYHTGNDNWPDIFIE